MQQPPDEVLIEQSKNGDMASFKQLVIRHEGKVAGVIRSMLGATAEAEDVGQEVFIRFYESLKAFRGDAQLSTYLVRIAMNLSLNELKRKKRSFLRFSPLEAATGMNDGNQTMDLQEQLQYEFARLSSEFKAVATLRLVEGYSTEETAEILKVPVGTVLSRLSRAQQKLRTALAKKLKS
ncbi:MAG: sigma-70 family RNA polymerase sigma factor [Cyclobacteriaceae bacterium]|nr:sigma-70 family RNA polymerase sigma factor [Cyclobacteriaceae bacterium]